jgi:hypothetical protein
VKTLNMDLKSGAKQLSRSLRRKNPGPVSVRAKAVHQEDVWGRASERKG